MVLVKDLREWRPGVAVVDSIGELLPLMNLASNSPDDFTIAHTSVLKAIAMKGACVIAIDHLAKGIESRAHGATGTAAKRRAVGGVHPRHHREPVHPRQGRQGAPVHPQGPPWRPPPALPNRHREGSPRRLVHDRARRSGANPLEGGDPKPW
jgi:hypothetical protein